MNLLSQWLVSSARQKALGRSAAICLLGVATASLFTLRVHAAGPGGISKILHIDCGAFCPGGSKPWDSRWDDSMLAKGYGYSVVGETYMGGAADSYCWFFTSRGSITIECPSKVAGSLHLFFLDIDNGGRRQEVIVEGGRRDEITEFGRPSGAWRRYELSASDTEDSKILIELTRTAGANAVI